jgi:hypothetical protein
LKKTGVGLCLSDLQLAALSEPLLFPADYGTKKKMIEVQVAAPQQAVVNTWRQQAAGVARDLVRRFVK